VAGSASRRGSATGAEHVVPGGLAGGPIPGNVWIAFAIFWGAQVWLIVHGLEGIKKLEGWSAPLLIGGGVLLWVGDTARRRSGSHPE
jgi:cytosine/uracil/thiamine/allantoin permease